MSDPKPAPDTARAFFETLGQIHIVAIHPNGLKVVGREFGTSVDGALDFATAQNAAGLNVYWTVNGVQAGYHAKPGKQHITTARFVHVDIDPPKSGGKFDKPTIIAALDGLAVPPSLIIDSGGGLQAFWRLDGPHDNLGAIETINRQVRDYFGADNCQNIDRLMRVPGFVNWPDARKRARGRLPVLATFAREDDGTMYDAADIAAAFPAPSHHGTAAGGHDRASVTLPEGWGLESCQSLGIMPSDPLHDLITGEVSGDRSAAGAACARHMANEGYTDAEIAGVLLNPANPIAGHFIDQSDPLRAVRRAIGLVRADGPENPAISHRLLRIDYDEIRRNLEARMQIQVAGEVPANPQGPESETGITVSGREPDWLAALGNGGLAQFVRHVSATAASPQPWVALGAAIASFGVMAGRRYAGPTNLRTNIYCIGVCDSGGGKDRPLRAPVELMIEAGIHDHVGGSKIASGQGLVTAVKRSPAILFPIDEIGFLISAAANRLRSPKHVTDIMDVLTEFYSLAGSTFLGTVYANDEEKPREVIEQPCLGLFGVTTPGVFWGGLSSANVLDGSLARMLIFESDKNYPDPQHDLGRKAWPTSLVEIAKAVAAGAEGHQAFPLGIGPTFTPKPYAVPYADAEASAFAREMREIQTRELRAHEGTAMTGIIARMAENAAKVALVKAITDNPARPVLTRSDLEWGLMIARRSVDTLMRAVNERVADSEAETKLKRVQRIVTQAGIAGVAHEELASQCRFLGTRRNFQDAIQFLVEGGQIIATEQKLDRAQGGGRSRRIYLCAAICDNNVTGAA